MMFMRGKNVVSFVLVCLFFIVPTRASVREANKIEIPFDKGVLCFDLLDVNVVRVQYQQGEGRNLPEWIYLPEAREDKVKYKVAREGAITIIRTSGMMLTIDGQNHTLAVCDVHGQEIFKATSHHLVASTVQGESTFSAELKVESPEDEYLYGLGQFQDGYNNVRGLSRRLTQVNTQIAIPFLMSSRGYGLLWNNYGLTNYNVSNNSLKLSKTNQVGDIASVNVTSTEGTKQEVRQANIFSGVLDVPVDGKYAILLDVGQSMARRHNLSIDGEVVVEMRNHWLPPTASVIVDLKAGHHEVSAELDRNDQPTIFYELVDNTTVLHSPVASSVDYTIFVGTPDEVIASYRKQTGEVPMLPQWALGYIHCRERYVSQNDLIENAAEFRKRQIPIDMIVQDWQYWGKYGWNSMKFDEENYPDPTRMVGDLHKMNMRLMLSVWSKIDALSEVGQQMTDRGFYIPGTSWIDFFNPEAAAYYWENFSSRLLRPYGIDAWWQDATEPENDDLVGRQVNNNTIPGEVYRNVYPLLVSKTVYEGSRKDAPEHRNMIFTRSGFSGIQRYGSVLWSGDVGNDWQTLRKQIVSGLGLVATGLPWWTYDAGGFFRPSDQYTNQSYIETLLRWVQASTFLPLMRIHGYQSKTEPWRYGVEAERIITDFIKLRYRLLPYIYSEAAKVSMSGYTLMRPLVFDFAGDEEALKQDVEYMFGGSLLVNPVVEAGVTSYRSYLPENEAGWVDFWSGKRFDGGQYVDTDVNIEKIPIFVKGGSILPFGPVKQYTAEKSDAPLVFNIYAGADAEFTLYEDEGINYNYELGAYSTIVVEWNDADKVVTIGKRNGSYEGMPKQRLFVVHLDGVQKEVEYSGKKQRIAFE